MKYISIILLLIFGYSNVTAQKPNRKEKKLAKKVRSHIAYLSSDELEGRGTGSKGEQLSAAYIADEFARLNLDTKGEDGYFQHMQINTLRIAQAGTDLMVGSEVLTLFQDFYPLSSSVNSGSYKGLAINLNYGISDESLNWDDYENADVEGKAVLIKVETPESDNPHSKFAAWGGISRRVALAIEEGAKAVIFYSSNKDNYLSGELKKNAADLGIPILFTKKDLSEKKSPQIELNVDIMTLSSQASNVVGYIDHGAEYTVVIGAHHDHLGYGEIGGSLAERSGFIHNGADDNASGIAGLIELARIIKKYPKSFNNNNYLFIAFTGEELGLLGSKHYVANPTIPLEKINYMINMDMIGKLDSVKRTLVINGVGTSPAWKKAMEEVSYSKKKIAGFKTTESGIGASDHTSFYLENIPAIHFFTGQHEHYHKPSDDLEIVNLNGEAFVITYICKWLETMDDMGKVEFTKTKDETQGRMRFKVTLGIMPDYIYDGEGLRVDGVREGKPGDLAGLKKGDIVTSINGKPILNMQDYMMMLTKLSPGDKVPVQIKRGEEFIELEVQF